MLDRSSMVPKPQSFRITSKFHLQRNPAKMKLTFDIEIPVVEVANEVAVDQLEGA